MLMINLLKYNKYYMLSGNMAADRGVGKSEKLPPSFCLLFTSNAFLPLSPALREKVRFSLLLTIKNIIDKFNSFHKFLIQA